MLISTLCLLLALCLPVMGAENGDAYGQPPQDDNGAPPPPPDGSKMPPPKPDKDGQHRPPQGADGKMMPPPPGGKPGMPPMPPDGKMGPPPGAHMQTANLKGAYILKNGPAAFNGKVFTSDSQDMSAIWVKKDGRLTLSNATIRTTGNTSSNEGSSFFGLNAAVLATKGGQIIINKGSVSSTGSGANGLFAADKGSMISASDLDIRATGNGGHGVMTSNGGAINIMRCDIYTTNAHGAPIATDRGGGTVIASDCKLTAKGDGSPLLYSTGVLEGSRLTGEATISEAVVIEGQNSVTLRDCKLKGNKNGAMIYQSFSGDAQGFGGVLKITGGKFRSGQGALLYVTNTNAEVELTDVKVKAASGILARAAADRWGQNGSNGGKLRLKAARENLKGDLIAENGSSIDALLTDKTTLRGKVTHTGLVLDGASRWEVTGLSSLTTLALQGGATLESIRSNGNNVTYDASLPANRWLQGKSYPLPGGGVLQPR